MILKQTLQCCVACLYCLVFLRETSADTIKLKDGTLLDGSILAETESNFTVEVEIASGTITKSLTVAKSDVTEIIRLTPEQRAERDLQRAYHKTQKYNLNPDFSSPLAYYDQVIESVLRKFITDYPSAPQAEEITNKIVAWQAERDKVAAGTTKIRGQWMAAADAQRLWQQERTHQLLEQGRTLLAQRRFEQAARQFEAIIAIEPSSTTAAIAQRFLTDVYRTWYDNLAAEQKSIEIELPLIQQRLERAQQDLAKAQSDLKSAQSQSQQLRADGKFGGNAAALMQAQNALSRASSESSTARNRLAELRARAVVVSDTLTNVQARATKGGVDLVSTESANAPSNTTAKVESETTSSTGNPELIGQIWDFIQNYWIVLVGAGLIAVWILSRVLSR